MLYDFGNTEKFKFVGGPAMEDGLQQDYEERRQHHWSFKHELRISRPNVHP